MKKTVKDLINQLEKMNPNEPIFSILYTKDDVKELEHYDGDIIVNPYDDELAEDVLNSMDDYDIIYECVYNCMSQEVSYQVDRRSKMENISCIDSPSY